MTTDSGLAEISDEQVLAAYQGVPIDHDSKNYWKGCLQRKLLLTRCSDCGHWIHYPRPMCPKCWSDRVACQEVSGKGAVYSLVFYHQGRGATGGFVTPRPIAAIELAEQTGLRVTAPVVDCLNEDMRVGMTVELTWIDWQGSPVPAFRPSRQEAKR